MIASGLVSTMIVQLASLRDGDTEVEVGASSGMMLVGWGFT